MSTSPPSDATNRDQELEALRRRVDGDWTEVPDWSSRKKIEADGYEAICVTNLGKDPEDCTGHDHVPGQRRSRSLPDVNLPDIPIERVQAAVKELLDLDDLRNLQSVEIGFGTIRAVVYALDEQGHKYRGYDQQPATHVLSRRVAR